MLFNQIIGQDHIKKHLQVSAEQGRIPHAQLFIGKEGSGTLPMAIAYAQFLLSHFSENPEISGIKCEKLQHPDLHFAFPITTTENVKSHPVSDLFLDDWRQFMATQPYGSLFNWLQHIGVENKQGFINVDEAEEIVKKLQLKSYEGGFKVMIIWMAEKMNASAANKLLKLIEEPPPKTVFLLIVADEEQLLSTIKSRCQALHFPVLSAQDIAKFLVINYELSENEASKIAHNAEGNFNKALELLNNDNSDLVFEEWFVEWVRTAFRAKGNMAVVQQLIAWSEKISKTGRETQKRFLEYCLQFFRQALLLSYKSDHLVYMETKTNFKLEKFASFVHSNNILDIEKELNDAMYHIERNGNPKIILLDLSIKLTRFLHKKEAKV
ncbi:MAG: DNA polymerase III subunit delta' [Flavobacteriia bacterium]|nr:DNA polymerase III subunit delta' [Flavobacteriia bacterium]OIP47739.1 MAG: DNA polymerase III subunit delta' [Flavobacteriaceae bacterium CG2_30_31_66]PIV97429.1 MAG: DNA polymerase III subunit delta' [Flavobacteriaceae bacterium CG17_big_fil_post_rev_8_21_14_2_50_31_13]PIX11772.1 MAG: DNA polymerase III subunit delta' [Flavobacteriaceae bacterium CG_4_8_14_3_um_filter_31_8]PIY14788.1 MAG: DNA polymerase III subunit delta' [Flavobacteriaceae bacterium CG_4_10_14_3_um_filter_31_253]PIZ12136